MNVLKQPKNIAFAIVTLLGVAVDQWSKWWVSNNIEYRRGEIDIIEGWLSFVNERNTGAAFSIMEGQFSLFMVFTAVAVFVLLDMLRRLPNNATMMAATVGVIMSGALGNFIDRVRLRYVVDFVKCYTDYPPLKNWLLENVGTNVYPIWNIADAAILVGVAIFLLNSAFQPPEEDEDEAPGDEEQDDTPPSEAETEVAETDAGPQDA